MKRLLSEMLFIYFRLVSNSGLNLVSFKISNSSSSWELNPKTSYDSRPNEVSCFWASSIFFIIYSLILDFYEFKKIVSSLFNT